MALIDGTAGSINIGPALSEVSLGYITEWEAELDQEIKKQGPFIGNESLSKVRGAKDCTGSAKGFVPVDTDAGQQDVIDAWNNEADVRLEFTSTDGYVLTIPTAIIAKLKVGQKADEGVPFEFDFESNGAFTYLAAA